MSDDAAPTAPQQRVIGRPFPPGVSGNPAGRPAGSRNKITERFLEKLLVNFEKGGEDAIEAMRVTDPAAYCKVIASLLPRDVTITARPFTEFTDDDLLDALHRIEAHLAVERATSGAGTTIEGEATVVIPALPEAAAVPRRRGILSGEAADGGEPAGQDPVRRS